VWLCVAVLLVCAPADLLRFIRVLDFSSNKLKNVPLSLMQLPTLEELHLGFNTLRFFPQPLRLHNLKILNVSHNFLEFLPDGLQECTSLTKLDLRYAGLVDSIHLALARCTDTPHTPHAHPPLRCDPATTFWRLLPSFRRAKRHKMTTLMTLCCDHGNGRHTSTLVQKTCVYRTPHPYS